MKNKTVLAYSNSRVPIDVLLEELRVPWLLSHPPLFQAFFNYRKNVQDSGWYLGCEAVGELIAGGENAYDISIDVLDSSSRDNLITVSVNRGLYTKQDAEVLKNSFQSLLQCFAHNTKLGIMGCPLYLDHSVDEAICLGKGPENPSVWTGTIIDRIDDMALLYPEKVAITDGLYRALTYAEMGSHASQIAARLADHGVVTGDCVGIYQSPGPDWICSLLGILRTGASCVPLDMAVGPERLLLISQDCEVKSILVDATTATHSEFLGATDSYIEDVSKMALFSHEEQSNIGPFVSRAGPNDVAFVAYTSGTTGTPKGVVIRHESYMNFVEHGPPRWGISEANEVILQQSSWAFDMSLCQTLVCLGWGGTLIVPDFWARRDPAAICQLIASQGVTFTIATPTEYSAWMRHGSLDIIQSQWRGAISGGDPTNTALLQAFDASVNPGFRLINCYGPCETTFACAESIHLFPLDISQQSNHGETAVADQPDALSPLPNCSVCIVDFDLKPVPVGVLGQVMIGGSGISEGYLGQPDATMDAFPQDVVAHTLLRDHGWSKAHLSGDLGRLDSTGHLLLQGRVEGSMQVKIGGIRMDLEDIESTMIRSMKPYVSEAVVSCRKGSDSSHDLLVAFVVLTPGTVRDQDKDAFLARLPQRLPLPQYMRPSLVLELHKIPWSLSNKVDRSAVDALPLPQMPSNFILDTSSGREEIDEMCRSLWQLWIEVLPGVATLQHEQDEVDFFHAGGSSLSLIRLQSLIHKRLDISVSIEQLFSASRLDQMARLVWGQKSGTDVGKDSEIEGLQAEDWDVEIEVPQSFSQTTMATSTFFTPPRVLVLTGATGLLGKEILRQLIDLEHVRKVYCLAVRRPKEQLLDVPPFSHSKVIICPGDLSAARLGLSEPSASSIFDEVDAVIHAGADVSFLKTYGSLRPANVSSTKELARLSLPRRLPFHFISSASVARLSGGDALGPRSVADFPPPRPSLATSSRSSTMSPSDNVSDGYNATKWVSEVFLERVARDPNLKLPIVIHRPSSVLGAEANDMDLMSSLIHYAQLTTSVPDTSSWKGQLDFISVELASKTILEQVMTAHSPPEKIGGAEANVPSIRYVYESGELIVSFDQIRTHLQNNTGKEVTVLPFMEWVDVLENKGMSSLLATYLRRLVSDGQLSLPRLVREGT